MCMQMDFDSDSSDDEFTRQAKRRKRACLSPPEHERVRFVKRLATPELQKFIEEPPGQGYSIIYAGINTKDGKVYVGKHSHGSRGKSFRASRMAAHLNPVAEDKHYFANAVRKYGRETFKWFVLWHGSTEEENTMECHFISPNGLNTISRLGGLGYNIKPGGEGGPIDPETIEKIRVANSTPENKKATSERKKAEWAALDDDTRQSRIVANSTAQRLAWSRLNNIERMKRIDANTTKSWTADQFSQASEHRIKTLMNNRDEHISRLCDVDQRNAQLTKYAVIDRDNNIRQEKAVALKQLPEYSQFAVSCLVGKISTAVRTGVSFEMVDGIVVARKTDASKVFKVECGLWTEEEKEDKKRRDATKKKVKLDKRLEGLTQTQQDEELKKQEIQDRAIERRRQRAIALKQIPRYSNFGFGVLCNSIAQARREGIVFELVDGVWRATEKHACTRESE